MAPEVIVVPPIYLALQSSNAFEFGLQGPVFKSLGSLVGHLTCRLLQLCPHPGLLLLHHGLEGIIQCIFWEGTDGTWDAREEWLNFGRRKVQSSSLKVFLKVRVKTLQFAGACDVQSPQLTPS